MKGKALKCSETMSSDVEITVCSYCLRVYSKRPFMCKCNSNVFLNEYITNEEVLAQIKEKYEFIDNEEES